MTRSGTIMQIPRTKPRPQTAARPRGSWAVAAIAALAVVLPSTAGAASPTATHIVQLRDGVSLAQGASVVRAAHGRVIGRLPIIRGLAVQLSRREPAVLARDPRVEAVSVNGRIGPQGTSFGMTPPNFASWIATAYPSSVFAPQIWRRSSGKGVGIAVIDTGIDGDLVDFEDGDGNSRVIASVVTNPDARTQSDGYGHGTHVAGIIAGDGSRRDDADPLVGKYIGIAPDADLISIKASDDQGNGTVLDAIYGLQFAVDHQADYNIRVVNLSVSSTTAQSYRTDPLDAAVEAAYFHGILVVAAAGNRGAAADATSYAPGNDPFALSVGAVDDRGTTARDDDELTDWSSAGTTQDGFSKPEVAAPGAHIVSTLAPGSAFAGLCPSCIVDGGYIRVGGTSMAAPVVSGVAALVFDAHPDWTPDEVKSTIIDTARDVAGGVDEVNAYAAVSAETPSSGANEGIVANDLVDSADGDIDYTRSSWGRSSWGMASGTLSAGWARSSWGCTCSGSDAGGLDQTRSSWGSATWLSTFSR
jgi:serine protease AprX